jgi:6-phosphogluconolactonase
VTIASSATFEILPDPVALADRVARWMCNIARAKDGRISICLSGGSTPKAMFERLVETDLLEEFPWARADWFWGDERFVPHDDAMSNFRMATEAMLAHAPVAMSHVHPIPFKGLSPELAAVEYELTLQQFYQSSTLDCARPLFDITLLGLGEDGHTASLFPGARSLDERRRWVVATEHKGQPRISLTYPALESSAFTAFLVAGADKRAILARVRNGDLSLPAALFSPAGALSVFADNAACGA